MKSMAMIRSLSVVLTRVHSYGPDTATSPDWARSAAVPVERVTSGLEPQPPTTTMDMASKAPNTPPLWQTVTHADCPVRRVTASVERSTTMSAERQRAHHAVSRMTVCVRRSTTVATSLVKKKSVSASGTNGLMLVVT